MSFRYKKQDFSQGLLSFHLDPLNKKQDKQKAWIYLDSVGEGSGVCSLQICTIADRRVFSDDV